jgi:uncharacterized integral membrane protein (TIGR00698 family)
MRMTGASTKHPVERFVATATKVAPGLALVVICVIAAFALQHVQTAVPPLMASVVLGAVLANLGLVPAWAKPGTQFAAKKLLRLGIVLLGTQLAVREVIKLGGPGLAVVAVVVASTFFGTQWLGHRMGISKGLSLLIATGYSICGASAVAAMEGVSDADEEEVAFAIALVTLCGSLAILVLPALGHPLGLQGTEFGQWVGASVHDVAQVVATASTKGTESLKAATIVKLTRVVLLAPMVAGVTFARRRQHPVEVADGTKRPPVMPLFVVGFLAAIALRSTGALSKGTLTHIKTYQTWLLAAALVGLGTGVQLTKLRRLGGKPLLLGLISWLLIAAVSYAGVKIIA